MIESALLLTKNYEELQETLLKASKDYADFLKTFRENLKPGMYVDAKDNYNKWRVGVVKSISAKGSVAIHFDGWEEKWDEELNNKSERLQPARNMTERYTGPDSPTRPFTMESLVEKVKDLRKQLADFHSKQITEMDPYFIVSFLRCDLYILVDHILCFRYIPKDYKGYEENIRRMTEDQQQTCMEFLDEFLLFVILYLRNLNQLMPVLAEWSSLKKPHLYLLNPVLAYLSCAEELLDSLGKVFGKESRHQRFYEAHAFKLSPQTQILELKATLTAPKVVPISNFVASFMVKRGPELIIEMLSVQIPNSQAPLPAGKNGPSSEDDGIFQCHVTILALLRNFLDVILPYLPLATKKSLVDKFTEHFIRITKKMSPKDQREIDAKALIEILEPWSKHESVSRVEQLTVQILIEYTRNTNMEKRLNGVQELRLMVEKCEKKKLKTIDPPKLKKTLIEERFLETIFGPLYHNEIAKRASYILQFMTADGISQGTIDVIWRLTNTQITEQKRTIYQLVGEIAKAQPPEGLELLITVIVGRVRPPDYSEPYLQLIRDLTTCSMTNLSKPSGLLSNINAMIGMKKKGKYEGFGLPLLWNVTKDPDGRLPASLIPAACKVIGEMLETNGFKGEREKYFQECISFLNKNPGETQLVLLAEAVLSSYPISSMWETSFDQVVIKNFIKESDFIDLIIASLSSYMIDLASRLSKKYPKPGPLPFGDDFLIRRFPHSEELRIRLDFLDFLSIRLSKTLEISPQQFKMIWKALFHEIREEVTLVNLKHLKNWVTNGGEAKRLGFFDNFMYMFREIIPFDAKTWTMEHFEIFEIIFRKRNEKSGALYLKKAYKIKEMNKLQGVTIFWELIQVTSNPRIIEKSSEILITTYSKSPEEMLAKYSQKWDKFFERLMDGVLNVGEDTGKRKMYLRLMRKFLKELKGHRFGRENTQSQSYASFIVVTKYENNSTRKEEITVPSNMTIFGFKEEVARVFGIPNLDFDIVLTHGLRTPYTFKWSDEEEFLVSTMEGYKDRDREKDIEINLRKAALCAGMTETIGKMVANIANNELIDRMLLESLSSEDEGLVEEAWQLMDSLPVTARVDAQFQLDSAEGFSEEHWVREFTRPSFRKVKYYLKTMEHLVAQKGAATWCAQFTRAQGLQALIRITCSFEERLLAIPFDIGCLSSLYNLMDQISEKLDKQTRDEQLEPHVDRLIDAGLQNLSLLLGFFKKNPTFNTKTQVFRGVFTNIVEVAQIKEGQLEKILTFPQLSNLILFYLTELPSVEVAESFSSAFKLFITSMCCLDSKNNLSFLAQLLFGEHLMKAVSCGAKSFIYFDVAYHLIENMSVASLDATKVDFKSILSELSNVLTKTKFDFKKDERRIESLLRFVNAISKKFPEILRDLPNFSDIVSFVYDQILFPVEAEHFLANPKARDEGYTLLTEIISCDFSNFNSFREHIERLYACASWRSASPSDWAIEPPKELPRNFYTGLKNLGCTCYINSMTQQLFMIEEFRDFLIEAANPELLSTPAAENVLLQFQKLMANLKYSDQQFFDPREFIGTLRDIEGRQINVLEQMDVDEFFNNLIDKLESSLKISGDHQIISRTFKGQECNEIIGQDPCSHTSERPQPFMALTLQVKGAKDITESLQQMVKGETLSGVNAYFCDKCEKKVSANKRVCIKKLPNVLILVLKRFDFDYDRMIKIKVNDYCKFPQELDMEPYTQAFLQRQVALQSKKRRKSQDDDYPDKAYFQYKLKGTVVHLGTADTGHYYSFIKDKNEWLEFNDTIVRPFDPKDLPEEAFGGEESASEKALSKELREKNRSAYVLFYEREALFNEDGMKIPSMRHEISFHSDPYVKNLFDMEKNKQIVKRTLLDQSISRFLFHLEKERAKKELKDENDEIAFTGEFGEINKCFIKYFLIVTIRCRGRVALIPLHLPEIQRNLRCSKELSTWFLEQFMSENLLSEFLIEPKDEDMRLFVGGLLKIALKKTTPPNGTPSEIENSVPGKFIKILFLATAKAMEAKTIHNHYRVLWEFSAIGKGPCDFLVQLKVHEFAILTIGKLPWSGQPVEESIKSIEKEFTEPAAVEETTTEITEETTSTEPTPSGKGTRRKQSTLLRSGGDEHEKKVLSLEELINKRREAADLKRQTHQQSWLVLALMNILKSNKYLPMCEENELALDEKLKLFLDSCEFILEHIAEAKLKKAANAVAEYYAEAIKKNGKVFDSLLKCIKAGICEMDDEMRPFLVCFKNAVAIKDRDQEKRIKKGMEMLLESAKTIQFAYRSSEILIDYVIKICHVNQAFCTSFSEEKTLYNHIFAWVKTFKTPKDQLLREKPTFKIFLKKPNPSLKELEYTCNLSGFYFIGSLNSRDKVFESELSPNDNPSQNFQECLDRD